jgi:malonate transporter and related proteins
MITMLANALVPVFAGLSLGYIAGLRNVVDNSNVKSFITFVMSFALPCSLFVTIARTPHPLLWSQGKVAVALAIVYFVVFGLTHLAAHRLGKSSAADSTVLALTLGFPNAAAVGLPLLLSAYGNDAVVSVAVAIAIGSITVSPITLAILESSTVEGQALSPRTRIFTSAWKAIKKPVVWAPVLGVLAVAIDFHMPTYVERSITVLGSATAGTALFLTGLVVSAQRFKFTWGVGWSVFAKNLQPALGLLIARCLSLPLEATRSVVLISAIPCGFFGIVFGKGFDATPEVASSSLIASYLIGIFTLADGSFSSATCTDLAHCTDKRSWKPRRLRSIPHSLQDSSRPSASTPSKPITKSLARWSSPATGRAKRSGESLGRPLFRRLSIEILLNAFSGRGRHLVGAWFGGARCGLRRCSRVGARS